MTHLPSELQEERGPTVFTLTQLCPSCKAILLTFPLNVLQNQSLPELGNKPHHGMFINILTLEREGLDMEC